MKIHSNFLHTSNIRQFNRCKHPEFTSQCRECYDTTEFFRSDFNWKGFTYFLNSIYKNTPQVNLISYACSTGKETYSLALALKTDLKTNSNKFFPIIAKDIDANSILKAKRGKYKITNQEAYKIDNAGDMNLYRHLEIIDDGLEKYAHMKDSLKTLINFSKADICQDIESIPNKNTVLVCRNFWNYLQSKEQIELANKLAKHLDNSCLVAIGSFDKTYGIDKLLEQKGFKQTEIVNVFRKIL